MRRRSCERMTKTNRTRKVAVGTVKKSIEAHWERCVRRNVRQVGEGDASAGRNTWRQWFRRSQCPTSGVRRECGAHPTRDWRDASVGSVLGRRPRWEGDRDASASNAIATATRTGGDATRRPCQVAPSAGALRHLRHTREGSTHKSRSARPSRSRRGAACWRTARWWRNAKISNSSSARVRRLDRIAARKAVPTNYSVGITAAHAAPLCLPERHATAKRLRLVAQSRR